MSRISESLDPSPYRDGLPGHKENTTSRLAAQRMTKAATLREKVLAAIKAEPRTADEIAAVLGESILSIRPRMSELRVMRKVRPLLQNGEQVRRTNSSGMSAIVWEAHEET